MPKTILFVDSKVKDYETLLADLASDVEVHLLNAQKDGVFQMVDILRGRSDLDSVQILSHGSGGSLSLGSAVLNNDNIGRYENALNTIGSALSENGDILLYGCNVARGEAGLEFIDGLAQYTGADVAASDDLTGNAALGGDWVLEARTGTIETAILSNVDYAHTLNLITFSEQPLNTTNPKYVFDNNTVRTVGVIVEDTAQPASPVIGANSSFVGPVFVYFDKPVDSVSFDVGYFDNLGSTRIEFRDAQGIALQSVFNTLLGVQTFSFSSDKGIASIVAINDYLDNSGFSVDTVDFGNPVANNLPNITPFILNLVGDQFKDTNDDGSYEGAGTIYIGRKDGIAQMLKVDGTVEYTDKSINVDGVVYSMIGAGQVKSVPLFQGKFTIDVATGKTSYFQEAAHLANEYTLGDLPVDFSGLTMNTNGLALGAEFKLLDEIGFNPIFSGSDALLISQNDVTLWPSAKYSLPNLTDFKLFGFVPVKEFSDFSIEYIAPEDKFKIQGKLVIDDFTKTNKVGEFTLDLAGENAIEIWGGKADIKGTLSAKTDFSFGGFKFKELTLSLDTKEHVASASAKIELPCKVVVPLSHPELSVQIGIKFSPEWAFNQVSISVDNLNRPIPALPEVFFQRLAIGTNNLATDLVEFSGGVGLTLGPQIDIPAISWLGIDDPTPIALVRLDLDGKFSSSELSGTSKAIFIHEKIAQEIGTSKINWDTKIYQTTGSFTFLDGLIKTNSGFKVDLGNHAFNVNMSGSASVGIPNFVKLIGGAQLASGNMAFSFSGDNNFSNDFVAGWGTINIQKLGFEISFVAGIKVYFDGNYEIIGTKNIPSVVTAASVIAPSAMMAPMIANAALPSGSDVPVNTKWILLSADWETSVIGNVPVQITMPNGVVISEADFTANNIAIVDELSNDTTKVVIVVNPQAGAWNINVVDPTNLGAVTYTVATDSVVPTIEITSPAVDVNGGLVTIDYNAFDSDSNDTVALFYDTDNQGFDGIQITDGLFETDGAGSFTWNTQGVATGNYFIYAMIVGENNQPVFNYSQGQVKITEEADLSVIQTVSSNSVIAGENFTYTISVTNNGASESKSVTLTETLPDGVTLVSSSLLPVQQLGNTLTFDFGNLAKDATTTFDIVVTAPQTLGAIMATAHVNNLTFDHNATNNTDNLTTIVKDAPPPSADLSVTRIDNETAVNLGQQYTYSLVITNHGQSTASNVLLTENLSAGINFISSDGAVSADHLKGIITSQLGSILNGQSVTVNLTVSSFVAGNLISTTNVSASENDDNPINNSLISTKPVFNYITGTADDNLLTGTFNNDRIDGLAGADTMLGGLGNDTYVVDNIGDIVRDLFNQGIDSVNSSINYALRANVENLTLIGAATINGTGNGLSNVLIGNDAANILRGGYGHDTLDGGAGADRLVGSYGRDVYYVDNVGDAVVEILDAGLDSVNSSINYTLTANVENLTLTGIDAINGTGNELGNILTGNSADNSLSGMAGADTLNGQDGADTLIGGRGRDTYILTETTAATDTLVIAQGDSLVGRYDKATGFALGTGTVDTVGVDKLDLATTVIAADATAVDGANSNLTGATPIRSHHISNGIISFDDINNYSNELPVTVTGLADVFRYLRLNITGGETVAFVSGSDTFVFQDGGTVDTLVELTGVMASSLNTSGLATGAVWIA